MFKRDEKILRWLVTKMDKYAVDYSVKRRSKMNDNKKEKVKTN